MKNNHEPLFHVVKRDELSRGKGILIRVVAIIVALIICGIITVALTGVNPISVYGTMVTGAFGSVRKTWVTLQNTAILLLIALALTPAFRMKFWNCGGEGQILMGGLASAACMITLADKLPNAVIIILMIISSIVAGAVWAGLPALFKALWNTNETLSTLMMNYIAIQLTSYFVALWENPKGSNCVNIINPDTNIGWFPAVFGRQYLLNVVIVMIMVVLMYLYLKRTKHGYEIAVVGASKSTARYAAIDVNKVTIRTVSLSGAICGIAGFIAVAGQSHTISTNTAGGKGFIAIIVAWLSKFNTFVMILVSLLLVFLDKGAREIASKFNINDHMSKMIMGIILFFILGSEFFINYKINSVKSEKKEVK